MLGARARRGQYRAVARGTTRFTLGEGRVGGSRRYAKAVGMLKRSVVTAVAGVVLVVLISVSAASASDRSRVVRLPLSSVPEGVSARTLSGTPVFFVREGDSVTTFLTDPHGTPGLHILWWCPTERIFIEPAHAGAFDVQGRIVGGPALRGLDQLKSEVKDRL